MSRPALPTAGDGVPEGVVAAIRERTAHVPAAAVVLGSGLGTAFETAKALAGATEGLEIPYADLPGFPPPSVGGHAGRLWLGDLGDTPVAMFLGRIHVYEGHPMRIASLTSRVAALLGAGAILLTAATGSIDPELAPGTLLVVRDHVNLMGANALAGWRMPDGSPAFVDLSEVYDRELAVAALRAARGAGSVPVAEGIYVAVPGPSYETPAEVEAFRRLGGSVVGMSMVPEAVAARALGLRVLGLSFSSNVAGASVSHEEVLEASTAAATVIGRVIVELLPILRTRGGSR